MNPSNLDASKSVCAIAKARLEKGLPVYDYDVGQLVAEIERLRVAIRTAREQILQSAPNRAYKTLSRSVVDDAQ